MSDTKASRLAHVKKILSSSPSIRSIVSYSNIEDRLRTDIYSENKTAKLKNIAFLRKTLKRLTRKIENGKSIHKKGDKAKVRKIRTLLPLLEESLEESAENGDGGGGGSGGNNTNNTEVTAENRARAECMEELATLRAQLEEARHLLAISTRRELEMRDELIRSRTAAADATRALIELQRRCNIKNRSTNNNDPRAPNNKRNTRRNNK
jgi:hypothetical protein